MPCGTLCKQCARPFTYGAFTRSGGPFQNLRLNLTHQTLRAAPLSLATTRGIVSFPQGTKMFQFPWFPRDALFYLRTRTWACPHVDFSIRTSPAQTAAHTYPGLFVVYHVLHRHLTPRHSPCALVASPNFRCGEVRSLALQLLSLYFSRYALVKELSGQLATPMQAVTVFPTGVLPRRSHPRTLLKYLAAFCY